MLKARAVECDHSAVMARAEPKLVRAAQEFEAQMMKELIRPMTRHEDENDDEGSAGALTDFGGEMLGQCLSRAGGFGIADRILLSFSQTETHCSNVSTIGKTEELDLGGLRLSEGQPMITSRRIAYGDPEQR